MMDETQLTKARLPFRAPGLMLRESLFRVVFTPEGMQLRDFF